MRVIDATMLTAQDTPANRRVFPQYHAHRPELGFPSIRLVALTSLASGMVVDASVGAYEGGTASSEYTLARELVQRAIKPGDVVVGDRLYGNYPFIATVLGQDADYVGRMKKVNLCCDFRRGKRLGPNDHLVMLKKPPRQPHWPTELYDSWPDTVQLRVVRTLVTKKGRRPKFYYFATTLLSAAAFPADRLADLYRQRWQIEVDLRAMKQDIGLDHLTCRTPAMLSKEIWARLLTYNLIRRIMAQASTTYGTTPRELSIAGTIATLTAYMTLWPHARRSDRPAWYEAMLATVATHRVGNRPGRSEPRQVKRLLKKFDLLKKPRTKARDQFQAAS